MRSKSPLLRRVAKLEAASMGGEVTLEELVLWSYRREERHTAEYAAFMKRFEKSRLRRLIEASIKPAIAPTLQ